MLRKSLKRVCLLLSGLTISGCSTVVINDAEWCADMGKLGATCVHTLTTDTRDLAKEQWDTERFGQVCTASENFANLKAAILKLCRETKMCSYETLQKINAFEGRIQQAAKPKVVK